MAEFALPTERLILRGWRESDVEPFHAKCNDARVMEYLGPPLSLEDTKAAMLRQTGFQASHGYCFWIVERRENGAMLGFCGLKPGPAGTPLEGRIEIGWRLRADAWGKGYAREAAQASLDWGFANLPDAARIWAITVPANSRSWGLMERLGMARHADLDFDHPGQSADSPLRRHITYSIGRPQ
jgi:RimJ/RimL family protein N-acetyltransferase